MITKEQIKNRMKGKRSIVRKVLAGAAVIALLFPDIAYAKENADIMQMRIDGNKAEIYIRGLQDIDGISAQIGQEAVEASESKEGMEIHTIVLLDNSLSITEQNKTKIMDILQSYIEEKNEKEAVSIAVFGEDIEYLAEKETDAQKLKEALEGVTYADRDSYLTDVLYDELARLGGEEGYTRFIIATDGVDNKAIGYTKEELQESLKENNYPVYALGCIYKENEQELENLFAISRLTNGSYFLLDEYEEYGEILTALREEIKGITVTIPESLCDGSERNLRLLIQTGNEETELKTQMDMPFSLKEEGQGEETVKQEETAQQEEVQEQPREEEASQGESAKEETTAQEAAAEKSTGGFEGEEQAASEEMSEESEGVDLVSVIAGAVIVVALVGLVLSKAKSGKKKGTEANNKDKKTDKKSDKKADKKEDKKSKKAPVMEEETEERATELVDASGWEEGGTMFLSQESSKYIVALRDKNDPSKIFRYPLFDEVVVGRKREQGVHIVLNYDNSVSGRHCTISRIGERFYIEDLHSSNHTYLDGKLVEGKVECKSGSTVTLGRLEMILELERM